MLPFILTETEEAGLVLINTTAPLCWGVAFMERTDNDLVVQRTWPYMSGLFKVQTIIDGRELEEGQVAISCGNIAIVPADDRSNNIYQLDIHNIQFYFIEKACNVIRQLRENKPQVLTSLLAHAEKSIHWVKPQQGQGRLWRAGGGQY